MSMISIKAGDTLGKLVSQYNRQHGTHLTVAQVAQANGIQNANRIQAGTKLIFPDQFESKAPQQVIRNADNRPVVRNGVNESVTVRATPDTLTTDNTLPSSQIQLRPQLPLPQAPTTVDASNADTVRRQRLAILQ